MSDHFQCGDNPALVGYIYGECEPDERRAIEQHLRVCPACAAEVDALGTTRTQLAAWSPPDVQLGFRMVSDAPAVSAVERRARWWSPTIPVWAQAAAAALIFASGLTLGIWRGTSAPATATISRLPAAPNVALATDLAALEQRLRSEIQASRVASRAPAAQTVAQPAAVSEAQILARVRALIEESEQRQQRELALRTAQVVRDFDSQRRVDLQTVRSIVGQVEGSTGAEIARQQQTLQYLMRVSQQR